jgi:hypothetical protein
MRKLFALFVAAMAAIAEKAHAALFGYLHSSGLVLAMNRIPTVEDFDARRVTNPAVSEVIRQRLYDYVLYPTAGAQQISFFQNPVGQGITSAIGAVVGSAKTLLDTNMELAGQLPSGKEYLIESIEVIYWAGSVATANTYTPATPGQFAAVAAAAVIGQVNDVNLFYQSGMLELNVLSKNYLRETPLQAFPPKADLALDGGIANNSATTSEVAFVKAKSMGRAYYVEPEVSLQPAVNFEVKLIWPAAVATPSGFNARLGVVLDGFMMRASQ